MFFQARLNAIIQFLSGWTSSEETIKATDSRLQHISLGSHLTRREQLCPVQGLEYIIIGLEYIIISLCQQSWMCAWLIQPRSSNARWNWCRHEPFLCAVLWKLIHYQKQRNIPGI